MRYHHIGIIGLGTMGLQLSLNFRDHDITVLGFDPKRQSRSHFAEEGAGVAYADIESLLQALPTPRVILLLIPEQAFTESFLHHLLSLLSPDDIVVDAGNSHYRHTESFQQIAAQQSIRLVGMGISGGAQGARNGAAIMLGGETEAMVHLTPLLSLVAAPLEGHQRCITTVGPAGSGHFVKMVHNGIEYAEMQILSELWLYLHTLCGLSPQQVADVFESWQSDDSAYLLETAIRVLSAEDPHSGTPLIEQIADHSNEKGTGRWSVMAALEYGAPAPSIADAVFSRHLSQCQTARHTTPSPSNRDQQLMIAQAHAAFIGAKISAYAQGFSIIEHANRAEQWNIDFAALANGWRDGCIIRGTLIDEITAAYTSSQDQIHLLMIDHFSTRIENVLEGWAGFIQYAIQQRLPIPVITASLSYYHSWQGAHLGADLIQGMRDYFGAHGFNRKGSHQLHHHNWTNDE